MGLCEGQKTPSHVHRDVSAEFLAHKLLWLTRAVKDRSKSNFWCPLRSAPERNIRALREIRRYNYRRRTLLVLTVPIFERNVLLKPTQTSKVLWLRVSRFPRSFIPERRLPRSRPSSRYILKDSRARLPTRMDDRTTCSYRANLEDHRDVNSTTQWIRAIYDRRIDHGPTNWRQSRRRRR